MEEIQAINLLVNVDDLEESLFQIYKLLRPEAEKSKTVFEELKGGFINLSCILYPENELEKAIVFRTFGKKFDDKELIKLTEQFQTQKLDDQIQIKGPDFENPMFNRTSEAFVMHSVSKFGLCKPVYAKYLNGMCFGYATGITVNGPLMLTNDYLEQLSLKLAKFHSIKIEIPELGSMTQYDKMQQQFGPSMKPMVENLMVEMEKIKEFPYTEFPKLTQILMEEEFLKTKIEQIGFGEIAFCHNDLNPKNIIWNPQERELYFIDFEMSMNNYVAFELGQIFYSFCGHFLEDFVEELLPNENYRLRLIRRYLEERYKIKNEKPDKDVFENEVKKLFIRSNICLLMFMLKVIGMIPFLELKPDFFKVEDKITNRDKLPYFQGRLGLKVWNEYLKIKDNFLKPSDNF